MLYLNYVNPEPPKNPILPPIKNIEEYQNSVKKWADFLTKGYQITKINVPEDWKNLLVAFSPIIGHPDVYGAWRGFVQTEMLHNYVRDINKFIRHDNLIHDYVPLMHAVGTPLVLVTDQDSRLVTPKRDEIMFMNSSFWYADPYLAFAEAIPRQYPQHLDVYEAYPVSFLKH